MNIKEGQTNASSKEVDSRLGIFTSTSVTTFSFNVGISAVEPDSVLRPAFSSGISKGSNRPCSVTVRFREVLGDFCFEAILLKKLDIHDLGPSVTTNELEMMGSCRAIGLKVELFHSSVDSFFCHCSTGDM